MGDTQSPQPAASLPRELTALLEAQNADLRDQAWAHFLNTYSRLILHAARTLGSEYDAVMDRYAYVVEQLRGGDFQRLRAFVADGRGKFSTWLTVVVRRICLDHHRHRYGRAREETAAGGATSEARTVRRRLVDLVADELDVGRLGAGTGDADAGLRIHELHEALGDALGQLPPRDRLLLTLRFHDDLSAREIAEVMGFSTPFHVYRRINATLGTLRQALKRRGIDDPVP